MEKSIILLEDDPGVRDVIELILDLEGYEVISFDTIEKFMAKKTEHQPALFILDVMLPDGTGTDVCRELKANSENVPVIMMSAHAKAEQITNACFADAFIAKPFDINVLLSKVTSLIYSSGLK